MKKKTQEQKYYVRENINGQKEVKCLGHLARNDKTEMEKHFFYSYYSLETYNKKNFPNAL